MRMPCPTLCHKINFSKFKGTDTIQNVLSDHNGIKLEINNKLKFREFRYM